MSRGFLLIDGNHLGHRVNNVKPLMIGDQPTQAIYGFLRSLRATVGVYSMLTPIVLWDGFTWRKKAFEGYKAGRDADDGSKEAERKLEMRRQYASQLPFIKEGLRCLGVRQMIAQNMEADDLAAILVDRYAGTDKRIMMITGDKDWLQLVGPGAGWFDPINNDKIIASNLTEKLGVKSPRAWLEVKAIMGDSSDDLPGVGGIGEKGAIDLVNTYGSVNNFINGVVVGDIDIKKLPKKFAALANDEDKMITFSRNMRAMDLRYSGRPAVEDLMIDAGKLDEAALTEFAGRFLFRSITKDVAGWLHPFRLALPKVAA